MYHHFYDYGCDVQQPIDSTDTVDTSGCVAAINHCWQLSYKRSETKQWQTHAEGRAASAFVHFIHQERSTHPKDASTRARENYQWIVEVILAKVSANFYSDFTLIIH